MGRNGRNTAVLCANMDGSHKLPVVYIRRYKNPRCMQDNQHFKSRYFSESNAWVDTFVFHKWLQFWHVEVQSKSDGPCLLLLDSCGSHGDHPVLDGVTYSFLPANTTALYQPMDQGLISFRKKKYSSCYLQRAVNT